MGEFILIGFILIGVILLLIVGVLYSIFGHTLPSIVTLITEYFQNSKDLVNPEAVILPNQEKQSSESMNELAAQYKAEFPIPAGQLMRDNAQNPKSS